MDKMFAKEAGLYHTVPTFWRCPTKVDTWVPPFVDTFRCWPLGRMLRNMSLLQKTNTVDWLSRRIQDVGIIVSAVAMTVANVVP